MVQTDLSMNRNKIDNILVAGHKRVLRSVKSSCHSPPPPPPGQLSPALSTLHIVVKNEAKWRQNFAILILFSLVITYLVSGGISDGQGAVVVTGQSGGRIVTYIRGGGLYLLLLIIGDIFPH